jgi:choline-sulfatase
VERILTALHSTAAGEDTLVMFFADHGDGMAAHRMVTKHTVFYEETTRVPFIAAGPGIAGGGRRIEQPLVSLLDVFPTLCAYAGVAAPAGLRGMSLLPWLRGEAPATTREHVVSQWRTEWGFTIEPGRMIRTARHKYTRYIEGGGEELYDLSADPGEMRNLAHARERSDVLARHRELLQRCVAETGDPFFSLPFKADAPWRSHPPGYPTHTGSSAAEEGLKAWAARKG